MATATGKGSKMTPAALAVLGFAAASSAQAHGWYTINGEPASSDDAQVMAARGLPFADYWVRHDGDWGFADSTDVQGNVYGRRPSFAERGLLYASSGWLKR
jgi:hypothetical protein